MSVRVTLDPAILGWSHYRTIGGSPPGQPWDAHTAPSYGLDVPRDTGVSRDGSNFKFATFEVSVAIDRNGTWVVTGRESVALLEHERRHWMMDILVARELHAALEALRAPTAAGLNGLATREFDWHRNTREKGLSDRYDNETDHGRNTREQARWATQVQAWYASSRITLVTPR